MGTGNSQKITLGHQGNLTACEKGREEGFGRRTPSWIFCDGSVRRQQTWCRIIRRHLRCPVKAASRCRGGWAGGGCCTPRASPPVSGRSGTRTWAGSTAPDSLPIPPASLSHPSPRLSAGESCWCQLYRGKAAAVGKLLSPCLCLPRAQEGFTLSPSLCGEEARSPLRRLEGKTC